MKKIDVIVKDLHTLELNEDAKKGDIIDLEDVVSIDPNFIKGLVEKEKRVEYQKMFESERRNIELNYENQLKNKEYELEKLRNSQANEIKTKVLEAEIKNNAIVNELKRKVSSLEYEKKNDLEKQQLLLSSKYDKEILELKSLLNAYKNEAEIEKNKEINALKEKYENDLREAENKYERLKREKSALNVKNIGEDLEKWCDAQMSSYMQNGFFNCKWYKDNKSIKEEGEVKGSKADFIFEIYKDNTHSDLLSSVCLEMKDENPDSTNKQTDSHYFKKLDENRNKKGCKFAVLVSNLEGDNPNIVPIYKVNEYQNMYVVRPAYMMVLLNFITSLTSTFGNILMLKEKEDLLLKDKQSVIDQFEAIKNTYLDKPLAALEKQVNEIRSQSEKVSTAARKIDEACDAITRSYLNIISDKISKFEVELNKKVIKKLD